MKLELSHTQRINLHALLGAQRGDVATIRSLWALQDRLALTPDEEETLELKREFAGGHERVLWNPALSTPSKSIDFSDSEIARMRVALEGWDGYGVAADRLWLEPLLKSITLP